MISNETLNSSSSTTIDVLTSNITFTTSDEIKDWIGLSLDFLTFLLAFIGNIFICLVVYNKKKLRSTTYILIVNIAISDLIGGIVIPSQWLFCSTYMLDMGTGSQRVCILVRSLQILSYYVSTFSMTVIAIDRYRLICKPSVARMKPLIPVLITWILGSIFSTTTLYSIRVSEYFSPIQGLMGCRMLSASNINYQLLRLQAVVGTLSQYLIPLSLIGYFYGMVMYTVWKRERVLGSSGGREGLNTNSGKQKLFNRNKKRTIKMLMTVVLVFAVSWFPTHLELFLTAFIYDIPVHNQSMTTTDTIDECKSIFYMIFNWLEISSCFYNVFIYCYFNHDFRSEAIRYWNCMIPKGCYCLQMALPAPGPESSSSSSDNTNSGVTNNTSNSSNSNNNYCTTQT
ncbi:G-protein coupled receptor 83-like [Oppia nitens]|uniref:G-protein coupled receptor 83-like n=1 Tax=Oppia nitens TaxID=1686743 RepID=UPI0023D9BDBD|nr:G-protein coupled receptor 83-like [Oppia nitens]